MFDQSTSFSLSEKKQTKLQIKTTQKVFKNRSLFRLAAT